MLLFGLLLLTVLFVASPVYADVDSEGWPTWAQVTSEKDGTYIIVDKSESGATMSKLHELCSYFYKNDGYYIEEIYSSGHMDLLFYVPDDAALELMNSGYELVVLPVSSRNDNFLFGFRLVKNGEVAFATGSNYMVRTNRNLNDYVVQKLDSCFISYAPDVNYTCSVKLYIGDYSEYSPSVEAVRNAIFGGEVPPLNEFEFLPKRYGVIEPPQNLKLTYTGKIVNNTDVKFTWTQNDERYKSWTTEIMIHGNVGYKLTVDLFGDFNETGTLLLKTDTVPTSNFLYKMNFVDLLDECRPVYRSIVEDKYGDWLGTHVQLMECSISFRNRYSDGQYTYYSNWVKVYSNEDHENVTVEYEYNDDKNGDENVDYTHDSPIGNVAPDSPYQGVDIIDDVSLGGLSGFISNGFGLAGENGIIDMFSDMFSFIPSSVWALILTGISVLIAIALLKAVL